jgi:hypothetical protein
MKEQAQQHLNRPKYSLSTLQEHTKAIRTLTKRLVRKHRSTLDEALADFNSYFDDLEQQPPTLERNVKMLLACKFLNHIYSAIILTECGLVVDAVLCARNALETAAFHWLVRLDPAAATEYGSDEIPRPVVVRKRLEEFGVDVHGIRELYSMDSELTHVSRASERFNLEWQTSRDGLLRIGGEFREEDGQHLFGDYFPFLIGAFEEPIMAERDDT